MTNVIVWKHVFLLRHVLPFVLHPTTGDLSILLVFPKQFWIDEHADGNKDVFTKGFAEGLGIEEPVSSPTFTILQIYEEGRLPLYHFDVYRIEEPEEMEEVGFDDYIYGDGVCLIEWANRIEEILPDETIYVVIEKNLEKGTDYRKITVVEPQ